MMNEFGQVLKELFQIKQIVDLAQNEIKDFKMSAELFHEGKLALDTFEDYLNFTNKREILTIKLFHALDAIEEIVNKDGR